MGQWLRKDSFHWQILGHVRSLELPDCWIAAGFVRNLVWNVLHDRRPAITSDVDVIWFDPSQTSEHRDQDLESALNRLDPRIDWSVCNQARMHFDNGDEPYGSSEDAMRYWPETATAVAVRRTGDDCCEFIAPFGFDDLLGLKLRPAGAFENCKRAIFEERVASKNWEAEFPLLRRT
ncbi:MAG: nucleotidyltransferase family protein [Sphingomonadales bacterium]|nr:nucleotidyltransferase family protein [Sphingomonadales bacterium]